jgi:predicted Rossmann fold nucleotide-binding protein DprA/Smf involved in DNA uptake
VEAPITSGALITARCALEHGRDLWVASSGTAGGVYAVMREGTRKLAEEGAPVISTARQICAEWGISLKKETVKQKVEVV